MRPFTRVSDFMTANPHWIALDDNLASAERRMRKLRVRQLPVLQHGSLRGIISERDVSLVRALELDPEEISLAETLAIEPYTVSPDAPLGRVARAMAAHRYSCAVVVEGGAVRGIMTVSDALRALAELLDRQEPAEDQLSPKQLRELILAEHAHLRQLLGRALESTRKVLSAAGAEAERTQLRETARAALIALVAHTRLEDQKVVPVLETIDAWGKVRASQMRNEHVMQRQALERALVNLDDESQRAQVLAASIEDVLHDILRDMDHEDSSVLSAELFSDDPTQTTTEGG